MVGCGVTEGTKDKTTGVVGNVWNACNSDVAPGTPLFQYTVAFGQTIRSPDAEQWTAWDRSWVGSDDPDVVILLAGRWEVHTRTYQGKWTDITQPAFAAYVKHQLTYTVDLASAKGARVVLMTAPVLRPRRAARRPALADKRPPARRCLQPSGQRGGSREPDEGHGRQPQRPGLPERQVPGVHRRRPGPDTRRHPLHPEWGRRRLPPVPDPADLEKIGREQMAATHR